MRQPLGFALVVGCRGARHHGCSFQASRKIRDRGQHDRDDPYVASPRDGVCQGVRRCRFQLGNIFSLCTTSLASHARHGAAGRGVGWDMRVLIGSFLLPWSSAAVATYQSLSNTASSGLFAMLGARATVSRGTLGVAVRVRSGGRGCIGSPHILRINLHDGATASSVGSRCGRSCSVAKSVVS